MSKSLRVSALLALLSAHVGLLAQAPVPAPIQNGPSAPPVLSEKVLWSFKETGAAPAFALGQDSLYVRYGGDVKRRALSDGHELWSVSADIPVREDDGLLFLINDKFELTCLEAQTGREAWKVQVAKEGEGSFGRGNVVVIQGGLKGPVVAGDKVLVGTFGGSLFKGRTGKLYAFDRKDGKLLWSFEAEDGLEHPPVVYKGMALFGGVAACYGVDLATGKQVWKAGTRNDNQWFFKVDGDTLFMASGHYGAQKSMFGGTLYAFDAATGQPRWTYDIGGPSVLKVAEGRLVGIEWGSFGGSRLVCLEAATGKKAWEFKEKSTSWPLAQDGKVVYLDKENRVHILDLATGKPEADLPAAADFQMGFFSGPWGRFMDARILHGQPVVGSWDKAKKETVLQVLGLKPGKVIQERRLAGEVQGLWSRQDHLVALLKEADGAYTLQVFGR